LPVKPPAPKIQLTLRVRNTSWASSCGPLRVAWEPGAPDEPSGLVGVVVDGETTRSDLAEKDAVVAEADVSLVGVDSLREQLGDTLAQGKVPVSRWP